MASIKRNRLTAVIPVTAVFLSPNPLLPEKPAETRPSWVLPVETASVRAVWYCPSEMPPVRRVVDESTGQWVLEYREISPLKARIFYTEFDRGLLAGHDTLRFRWKLMADNAWVQVQLSGYPEPGREKRNYYLNKRPPVKNQWQEVWLDLNTDDDLGAGCQEASPGKVRLAFLIKLWDMGELSDPPQVRVRIADIRLEKHPLKIEGDVWGVKNIASELFLGQSYPLKITNRSEKQQTVLLSYDSSGLNKFTVNFSEDSFLLQPGSFRVITAEIKVPSSLRANLPPLYSEQVSIFAATAEDPDYLTTWYHGFMLYPLVGALPPGRTDFPRFKNEQERAEVLTKRGKEKTSREAEALLKTPVQVPELRHGYSGAYMDPGPPRKPLRFHGPARHYSERTGTYVDIGTMPEAVQKAAAFVHHSYLSEAAYTLADAWWQTGRKEFAARAAEILLAYAERYPDFSPVSPFATGYLSRVGHAMLGEAWWFHRLPEAFDLVKASGVLSAAEEEKIVRGLLVPAMITLRQHRVAANQQAEINAAFGKAALVTDRWDYAALALDGEYGIRAQWRLDFDRDGFTMEKEIPYHMAALGPFVELANCLEAMGVKVYDQNFKKLFDAPLVYDLTGRPPRPDLYLCAYRHYRDSRYLPLIAHLLKPEEIPPTAELSRAFRNSTLEAAGYTVLRSGDEKSGLKALTMNWGCPSHRGGTVLLNPYLYWKKYSLNEHVLRIGYGYEQSGFSYTAAAGNSLVRDGQRHSMLRANQVSLLEGVIPAGRWTSPGDRPLYSGLEWSRSAFICGDSFVLVDQVKNDRPARFDWITYLPASLVEERPVRSWTSYPSLSSEGDGYQYLVNPEKATLEKPAEEIYLAYRLQLEKETPCGALTILSPPATLFRAQAYVHWHPKLVPAVICRYGDVTNLWLVAIYTAEEKTSPPLVKVELLPVSYQGVKLPENEALALRLTNASGTFLVMTSKYEGEHTAGEKNFHGYLGASKEK